MSPGLLGLDCESRDTNLGHLMDVIVWLPVELKMEDDYPTCLGRKKTSSPRQCSHGPELLDLVPPMAIPVLAKSKAESPTGEKRSLGSGREENAQKPPF